MAPLCTVYGLYSTEDMVVRYIGQTMQAPQSRLVQHLAEATRPPGTSRCHRWIRKVLRTGYELGITVLEADCLWDIAERKWIAEYRNKFPELMTNLSDGGCGYAGPRSEETRQRMRKPKSQAHRQKIREHITSPEMRRKALVALSKRNPGNTYGRGEKNGEAVLGEKDVIEIHELLRQRMSLPQIAKTFGVSKAAISTIRTGRTWKYLGSWSAPT